MVLDVKKGRKKAYTELRGVEGDRQGVMQGARYDKGRDEEG